MARSEYDGGVVKDVDTLLTKFFSTEGFYLDELLEVNLHAIFARNVEIGRLVRSRLGLRYENLT